MQFRAVDDREASASQSAVPAATEAVRYLRRTGLTEVDLADGTGASPRTVRRWASNETVPQTRYEQPIDDLRAIVEVLEESLTHKGVRQWLRVRSRYLHGDRPIDLLRKGQFDRVYEAAVAFRDGQYL